MRNAKGGTSLLNNAGKGITPTGFVVIKLGLKSYADIGLKSNVIF